MKRTILLPLMFACVAVQAAEWVSLGQLAAQRAEGFVDVSSIRVTGDIRRAWIKTDYAPRSYRGIGDSRGKWVASIVIFGSYNCADQTFKMGDGHFYYEDGTNSSELSPATWQPVAPDTVGDGALKFVCAWKPK